MPAIYTAVLSVEVSQLFRGLFAIYRELKAIITLSTYDAILFAGFWPICLRDYSTTN